MASIDDYAVPVNRILDFPSKSDPNPEDFFEKTKKTINFRWLVLREYLVPEEVSTCSEKLSTQFVHFRGVFFHPPPLSYQKPRYHSANFGNFGEMGSSRPSNVFKGPFSAKHQEIGSNQRHLQTILLFLVSVLSEKSENLYQTFLEPVELEKEGFSFRNERLVIKKQI